MPLFNLLFLVYRKAQPALCVNSLGQGWHSAPGKCLFWRTHEALFWSESSRIWHKPSCGVKKALNLEECLAKILCLKKQIQMLLQPLNYSLNIYFTTDILIIIFCSKNSIRSVNIPFFLLFFTNDYS